MKTEVLGIKAPKKECTDNKCPFHGEINVKKELFKGRVVKKDINRSATIEWFRPYYVQKYERYEVRKSRLRVHNPSCIDADIGEEVLVARTRPLSKTKNHVILEVIGVKKVNIDAEHLVEAEVGAAPQQKEKVPAAEKEEAVEQKEKDAKVEEKSAEESAEDKQAERLSEEENETN